MSSPAQVVRSKHVQQSLNFMAEFDLVREENRQRNADAAYLEVPCRIVLRPAILAFVITPSIFVYAIAMVIKFPDAFQRTTMYDRTIHWMLIASCIPPCFVWIIVPIVLATLFSNLFSLLILTNIPGVFAILLFVYHCPDKESEEIVLQV